MEKEKNENRGQDGRGFQDRPRTTDLGKSKSENEVHEGQTSKDYSKVDNRAPITNDDEFIESDPIHYNDQHPDYFSGSENLDEVDEDEEDFNDEINLEKDEEDIDFEGDIEGEMGDDYKKESNANKHRNL